jgi:hypothetical protein
MGTSKKRGNNENGKFFLLGYPVFMSKVPRIGEKFLIGIFQLI